MFSQTSNLDAPGGENDLLDCLACRVEEAGLSLARHVQGANLCCTGTTCDTIMTRLACQRSGAQMPSPDKRARSDFLIENGGDQAALERAARVVWDALSARA
jgi:hypothetical protein